MTEEIRGDSSKIPPAAEPRQKGDISQGFLVTTDLAKLKMRGTVDDMATNDAFMRQLRNKEMGVKDIGHDVRMMRGNNITAKICKVRDDNLFTPLKDAQAKTLKGNISDHTQHQSSKKKKR